MSRRNLSMLARCLMLGLISFCLSMAFNPWIAFAAVLGLVFLNGGVRRRKRMSVSVSARIAVPEPKLQVTQGVGILVKPDGTVEPLQYNFAGNFTQLRKPPPDGSGSKEGGLAMALTKPCAQCPWRLANQGKASPGGFYTKGNLLRMWNQIRKGVDGNGQSCHLTDPGHPDHIAAGCSPNATQQECPGSVIVVIRELKKLGGPDGVISPESIAAYLASRRKGLTKTGIHLWALQRMVWAGKPLIGGAPLPDVNDEDPTIGLPADLAEG